MSKLDTLFVENINKAVKATELMTDLNQKPMAYAAISQALATYLSSNGSTKSESETEEVVDNNIKEDMTNLIKENEKVSNAINETINQVEGNKKPEIKQNTEPAWQLPYDENGIPYLVDADYIHPERVLAYNNAMTPELEAKKREIEKAQGEAVLNEDLSASAPKPEVKAPEAQKPEIQKPATQDPKVLTAEQKAKLEEIKVNFCYMDDSSILDNLYFNFTSGISKSVTELTGDVADTFFVFIQDELAKAYQEVEQWKASWITKEGLDALISQAYGVEGGTIEEYLFDGNVFWFLEHVALYNANSWLSSYKQDWAPEMLDSYVKQCFENTDMTIDNIDDSNVVAFVYYVQQATQQSA